MPASNAAKTARAADETRRVFICYPRSALRAVTRFHEALAESLAVRGRTYEVFRDKGDGERIEPGEEWEKVLQEKLAASVCCVVAMVPAIFESTECKKEIETFRAHIKDDPRRFFLPIDFLDVQGTVQTYLARGDETARLMHTLDRHDFTNAVHEPNQTIYESKVDAIADAIHRRIEARGKKGASSAIVAKEPDTGRARAWSRPTAVVAPFALVAILALVLIWFYLDRPAEIVAPPPTEVAVGEPLDIEFDLVLPTTLKTLPQPGAPEAGETVGPGRIKAGIANIHTIRQVVGKPTWYQLAFEGDAKAYLDKDRVPAWVAIDPAIELYRKVLARRLPLFSEAPDPALALAPDSFAPSRRQFGGPLTGSIDNLHWYRVRQSPTGDVFLSEDDTRDALAAWADYRGCLRVNKEIKALTAIMDGMGGQSFVRGSPVRGELQTAEVRGETWFRYRREQDVYGYLRRKDVDDCS
jgi:hypothetical protein